MKDPGVSSVVSEVLLIALVLILVPIVTISLMNQVPEDRIPTVTIQMGPLNDTGYLFFYHKGGDWIKKENVQIFRNGYKIDSARIFLKNQTFDLGDTLGVSDMSDGDKVSIVTKNSVIFTGIAKK
ncbi:type IV pilin [uncultured Methanospirillum sp.]|uniref:type IV pilin n=1 Tax=uncultured Methanospirillum sp. TaxID=262503 RepID=UPI0029C86A99|nr:type IV pilin [uncultured Methanospirillum sp.]